MIDKIIAQARTGEIGDGKIFGKFFKSVSFKMKLNSIWGVS